MISLQLVYNLSLLIALSVLSRFVEKKDKLNVVHKSMIHGIIFGSVAVIGMLFPVNFSPGLIFDGRSVVISLCALFFGPVSGVISAAMAVGLRISQGGVGTLPGILVVAEAALFGLIFHYLFYKKNKIVPIYILLIMGLLVHITMVLLMLTLPAEMAWNVVKAIGVPVISIYPIATILIGKIISDNLERNNFILNLKESEEKYRLLVENSHDVIYTLSKDGIFTFVSPAWTLLLGHPVKDVLNRSFQPFIHPDDLPACLTFLQKMFTEESSENTIDYRVLHLNGTINWHSTRAVALRDSNGQITGFLGIARDVTEQNRLEGTIKENEDRLSKIMLAANDGIWDWDLKTNKVNFDPRYYLMSGYNVDEFPHDFKEFQKRVHPDDVDHVMKHLKGEIDRFIVEFRFLQKSGEWQWIQGKGDIVERNEEGKPKRFIATHRDITEQKKLEENIKESLYLLKNAGKLAKFGGWSVDLNKDISYWSDEVAAIHEMPAGYTPSVRDGINFYAPEWREKITHVFANCAQKGIPYDEELEIITSSGKKVWVRTNGEAVKDDNGNIYKVQGGFQDISERKQAENELKESEERFKALHNASFGGIAIHDKGMILECNQGLSQMTGYSLDELIGMDGLLLIAQNSRELVLKNIISGNEKPYESFGLRKNGEIFPLRLEARNVRYKGKNVRTVEFRDITERKQSENALKSKIDELNLMNSLMIGRELKMIELKTEINELLKQLGKKEKYEV